jgi:hypothetical protein
VELHPVAVRFASNPAMEHWQAIAKVDLDSTEDCSDPASDFLSVLAECLQVL